METKPLDFIRRQIQKDRETGVVPNIRTRFPPEPNGHLHIGHAKAVCLNFEIAREFGGTCNLRFDDTNPEKENEDFVQGIQEDIRWLGYDWDDRLFFASDYFEIFYGYALELIKNGKAYVDSLSPREIREYRGTPTEAGKNSPYRNRSIEENLTLFRQMKEGQFEAGEHILRAKIDMAHPNLNMRDPALYRILKKSHHRTKDRWCIYPVYDFAHGYEDAVEGITHSLCTLEFENHRPLYNWFLEHVSVPSRPRQIEFARLNISYTVMSKRILSELVDQNLVTGWDDPRLPTLQGLRRRGIPPRAIRRFCREIGISKVNSQIDYEFLEYFVREELNKTAHRLMAVIRPLQVIITNYPEDKTEFFPAENNPEDPATGTRNLPFSRELYIEQDDFSENPPPKYFRLSPGKEVRLKHAYYITCEEVIKDERGHPSVLLCRYDPESRGGGTPDGRKVKGTLHWVSRREAVPFTLREYRSLFTRKDMNSLEEGKSCRDYLNPHSRTIRKGYAEPFLAESAPGTRFQFLRLGYYCTDLSDHCPEAPVVNSVTGLKDTWAKLKKQQK